MKHFGTILFAENEKEWVRESVRIITDSIISKLNYKDRFHIAISGGNTPEKVFLELVKSKRIASFLWEKVDFFWVDERLVEHSNLDNNAGNALKILGKLSARFFPMFDEDLGENRSVELYKDYLMDIHSINGMPSFDLIMLGMGEDGHTASLFPGTEGLNEQNEPVIVQDVPQLGKRRMTLTFPVLKQAQQLMILFHGEKKIKILNDLFLNQGEYPIAKLLDSSVTKTWIFYE